MKKQEFLDIFEEELFCLGMKARSKDAALGDLVEFLFQKKRVNNRQAVLNTLLAREQLGSTGLGKGVAIPHSRSMMVDRLTVLFARYDEGLKFDAEDKKPVFFVFLILAPPQDLGNQYLPFIGKLVEIVKEKKHRDTLLKVENYAEFKDVLQKAL